MADIFISYARKDKEKAKRLADALEKHGWSVWWDPQIPAGSVFDDVIEEALDAAKCVLVLWSSRSIKSRWVKTEAGEGVERGILVPVLIEDVKPPLAFRRVQAADLSDWKGEPGQRRAKLLLESIERIAGKPPQKRAPTQKETRTESQPPKPTPPKQSEKKQAPIPKRKPSFFFKLGPMIVSMTFVALALTVGFNIWFGDQKRHATNGVPESASPSVVVEQPSKKVSKAKKIAAEPIDEAREKPSEADRIVPTDLPKSYTNSVGMEFVLVPAGTFQMGSDKSEFEQPVHQVTIRMPFYMQTTEVTQGQWKRVMGANPSSSKNCGDNCPVESVSWDDVKQFIAKLNEIEEREYRLPTEAEWEYAARSGGMDQTYAGGENLDELGWYSENSSGTRPVGQKKPNGLGIYDMSGNVWEWVEDDWHGDYKGAPEDGSAWIDDSRGTYRVIRGGSWRDDARRCRSASRNLNEPGNRFNGLGFRLSRSVPLGP